MIFIAIIRLLAFVYNIQIYDMSMKFLWLSLLLLLTTIVLHWSLLELIWSPKAKSSFGKFQGYDLGKFLYDLAPAGKGHLTWWFGKGSVPQIPEKFRFRNACNLPSMMCVAKTNSSHQLWMMYGFGLAPLPCTPVANEGLGRGSPKNVMSSWWWQFSWEGVVHPTQGMGKYVLIRCCCLVTSSLLVLGPGRRSPTDLDQVWMWMSHPVPMQPQNCSYPNGNDRFPVHWTQCLRECKATHKKSPAHGTCFQKMECAICPVSTCLTLCKNASKLRHEA